MQILKKRIIISVIIIIIAGISYAFYVNYQKKVERQHLDQLIESHPQGQSVRETIQKAEAELKDDDKENDFLANAVIGSQRYIVGDYTGAKKYFLAALKIRPNDNLVLWNLANVYIHGKDFVRAEERLLRLVELDPYTVRYYTALADLYRYNIVDENKMIDIIQKGLANNDQESELLGYLAVYYREKEINDKAIEYFERLVKYHPENESAQRELYKLKSGSF